MNSSLVRNSSSCSIYWFVSNWTVVLES
jgi:hypothetical protein